MAQAFRDQIKSLAYLGMLEQRLSRQFEKTLKQLRELQAERHKREALQMEQATQLLEMHQEQELPYDPKEDGFVFSTEEIEQHIRREERLEEARDAHEAREAAA
jgi:cysteinyl-tRNA synthetase